MPEGLWPNIGGANYDTQLSKRAAHYVDAGAGSDNGDGTSARPWQTLAELARRLPVLRAPTVQVNLVGQTAFDALVWEPTYEGPLVTAGPTVTVLGNEVQVAPVGPATGVIAAASQKSGNVPPKLSDTGGAAVALAVDSMIRMTSGAAVGALTAILLQEGAGIHRVQPYYSGALPTPTTLATAPSGGDTYRIITWPTIPKVTVGGSCQFNFNLVNVTAWQARPGAQIIMGNAKAAAILLNTGGLFRCFACLLTGGASPGSRVGVGIWTTQGCGINRVGQTTDLAFAAGSTGLLADTVYQGGAATKGILVGVSPSFPNGTLRMDRSGVFDVGSGPAIRLGVGATLHVAAELYGSGNAGTGVDTDNGGSNLISVASGIVPTLATTGGQELRICGKTTFPSKLVAGAVVPATASCINWAEWDAAPHSRQVCDYGGDFTRVMGA